MALATRCPHCHTTFRVAHDQLKLRAGIVRCGACKQIFNGIEHLLRQDEAAPSFASHGRAPTPIVPAEPELTIHPSSDLTSAFVIDQSESAPEFTINTLDFDVPIEPNMAEEPLLVTPSVPLEHSQVSNSGNVLLETAFTQAKYHVDESSESNLPLAEIEVFQTFKQESTQTDSSEYAIPSMPDLPRNAVQNSDQHELSASWQTDELKPAAADEPGFLKKWRQQQRTGKMRRILLGIASIILLVGLLAQSAYLFRKQIAAWFPPIEPVLAQMCIKIGCQINLPAQIAVVSLESSELQTLAASKNAFVLTLLLANHSQITQAWPSIELTLNDANEQPVARRIFMPSEYLDSLPGATKGLPANTEQPVKLFFELAQLKASGYRIYLFYS